jgi:hypothetical protein
MTMLAEEILGTGVELGSFEAWKVGSREALVGRSDSSGRLRCWAACQGKAAAKNAWRCNSPS